MAIDLATWLSAKVLICSFLESAIWGGEAGGYSGGFFHLAVEFVSPLVLGKEGEAGDRGFWEGPSIQHVLVGNYLVL